MSTDIQAVPETEDTTRTNGMLVREFAAEFTPGEGRTIDVLIVPYGERIQHNDGHGGVPKGVMYDEEWQFGAFSEQVRAADVAGRASKVLVNFEHGRDLLSQVGNGIALREAADGFHGTFEIHDDVVGEKALTLIKSGSLDGVSLEAKPLKSVRGPDGVVRRVRAHLSSIALTRFAAYKSARILALREEAPILDEALLPLAPDPVLVERLRAQGVRLPDRYTKAHPAGHPDTIGTPEDGTRHTDNTTSSEEQET